MKLTGLKDYLDRWAPPPVAEEWDNVGLLVGDASAEVSSVLVALEVTDQIISEAMELKAQVIVTHHPLIFKPISRITADSRTGRLLLRLIQNDLALYTMHTNLDSVERGVNYALADLLKVRPEGFLKPASGELKRLAISVALEKAEAVIDSLMDDPSIAANGSAPMFYRSESRMTGSFPDAVAVRRERIEMVLESWRVGEVSERVRRIDADPVIEVLDFDQPSMRYGLGLVGVLEKPMRFDEFARFVRKQLNVPTVKVGAEFEGMVKRIALCGGSCGGFIANAIDAGADAFVTGEIRYHDFQDFGERIGLVEAGHYETERPVLENIKREITNQFNTGELLVHVARAVTNPVSYVN